MATDRDRQHLYVALEATLGEGPASTLMHLPPPQGWHDVARHSDLAVLRGEMAELRAELKGEMAELRGEMRAFRGETQGELAELRAKIDAQIPKFLAANVPLVFGAAGLVFAAIRVA
ncbi:MAG: hypothetical protein ACLGI2_00440 [Acidimicrobiia bacterium]|jgi:hypothetical protein